MAHDARRRVLLSYWYHRDNDLDAIEAAANVGPLDFFGDSGAFSAHHSGADVDVEKYGEWLLRWQHKLSAYVALDVIGDHEATQRNLDVLEGMGLAPLPVFHGNEPWPVFEAWCERYPYIALGGMVGEGKAFAWCVKAFLIASRTGTVLHGFGQTKRKFLRELPWYSVDSSSWGRGHRYGIINVWDETREKFVLAKAGSRRVYELGDLIRDHDGDVPMLATPHVGKSRIRGAAEGLAERGMLIRVNTNAWRHVERTMERRHGEVVRPDTLEVGPRVYLAAGSFQDAVACVGGEYRSRW